MPPSHPLPLAVLVAALAFPGSAASFERHNPPATAAATRTVKVADDFFSPKRLTVARGTRIKWAWSRRNADIHDVYLDDRPKGARRFHSAPASRSATFTRRLRKAGTYKILCTFHERMSMRIVVAR